jgi:REP element-mobilizing transposase RayT
MHTRPQRKPTRASGFDYREPGPYFVTICEYRRINRFGMIHDQEMQPNAAGQMVLEAWESLTSRYPKVAFDVCVLMPNHFHALLTLGTLDVASNAPVTAIVQLFNTLTTKRYIQGVRHEGWPPFDTHLWQPSFHDRIVRNDAEMGHIRTYIANNPALWSGDTFHEP